MKVTFLDLEDGYARFRIDESDAPTVNALRRVLITDVPKMAIDKVEFHLGPIRDGDRDYESSANLFDEIIAHRLGLLPIPTDLDTLVMRSECTCDGEGCANCSIMYSINKKGPSTLYSGDLEPLGDESLRIPDQTIPIAVLNEHQAVLIYATAYLGTAKDHVKWQVTSGAGYQPIPIFELVKGGRCDDPQAFVDSCPRGVFSKKGNKLVINDEGLACNFCASCLELDEPDYLTIKEAEGSYLFQFETDGSMSAKDAILHGLEILEARFEELKADIE